MDGQSFHQPKQISSISHLIWRFQCQCVVPAYSSVLTKDRRRLPGGMNSTQASSAVVGDSVPKGISGVENQARCRGLSKGGHRGKSPIQEFDGDVSRGICGSGRDPCCCRCSRFIFGRVYSLSSTFHNERLWSVPLGVLFDYLFADPMISTNMRVIVPDTPL